MTLDKQVQEMKLQQLHQKVGQCQEEMFTVLRDLFTNHQDKLKSICENREREIENMALEIRKKEIEIKELSVIIQSKDSIIQENAEIIASKDSKIKKVLSVLQSEEVEIKKLAGELQSNKHEVQEKKEIIVTIDKELQNYKHELQKNAIKIEDLEGQLDSIKKHEPWLQLTRCQDWIAPWKIDRSEIRKIRKKEIGRGGWGVVYSATFRGERVAIKEPHRLVVFDVAGSIDMIKREISIMAHIQHPNLVRFIGAVVDKHVDDREDAPIIILELLDMNLRAACTEVSLNKNTMLSIFCDVAYALHYLHEQREPIIHRDISAPNVLLKKLPNSSYRAKVSDFGSANLMDQSKTAGAGAYVYSAPEMFPQQDISSAPPPQTTKVDIFSYGILLLEVVSKDLPVPEKRYIFLQDLKKKWERIHTLTIHCTNVSPADRPAMSDVLNILHQIQP